MWSQGTTMRPVCSWMPWPGPVAYQVQSGCITVSVMLTGSLQVSPSSRLCVSQTVRLALP